MSIWRRLPIFIKLTHKLAVLERFSFSRLTRVKHSLSREHCMSSIFFTFSSVNVSKTIVECGHKFVGHCSKIPQKKKKTVKTE